MLPDPIEYLWLLFQEFSLGIVSGGMGPAMAAWGDLRDWRLEMAVDLDPWEKRALMLLSHHRAVILSETTTKPPPARQPSSKQRQPSSTEK